MEMERETHGTTSNKSLRTTGGHAPRQESVLATGQETTEDHDLELTAEGLRQVSLAAQASQRQEKCKGKYEMFHEKYAKPKVKASKSGRR